MAGIEPAYHDNGIQRECSLGRERKDSITTNATLTLTLPSRIVPFFRVELHGASREGVWDRLCLPWDPTSLPLGPTLHFHHARSLTRDGGVLRIGIEPISHEGNPVDSCALPLSYRSYGSARRLTTRTPPLFHYSVVTLFTSNDYEHVIR